MTTTTLKYKRGTDGRLRGYITYLTLLTKEYRIKVFPVDDLNKIQEVKS